jgi:hypothetical protein
MEAQTGNGATLEIVLIHGLWMTPRSWEKWKQRDASRGHTVDAPGPPASAWPRRRSRAFRTCRSRRSRPRLPPKATRHNAEKYETGVIAFKEFEGRPHFPRLPGWEEGADYALDWALDPVANV